MYGIDLKDGVTVTVRDYPAEHHFPAHAHEHGQFAFASRGAISVATSHGRWFVPSQRACWMPAGVSHEMTMSGSVTMLNAYLSHDAAQIAALPTHCSVLDVSPLLRLLLENASRLDAQTDVAGRADKLMSLLVAEIAIMPVLPLNAPMPRDPRLVRVCRMLFDNPSVSATLDEASTDAHMTRRTFTRLFRAETGMSFGVWKQQVCLLAALARIELGQTITRVALDLGYSSPSAFTAAFRRALGESPGRYVNAQF